MVTDKTYIEHPVFEQLSKYAGFYENLAFSIQQFVSMGTRSVVNIDIYVYHSMRGTLESIKDVLTKGHINDAYTLLRKYYDVAIINVYTNLYLDENVSVENFVVEEIEKWLTGKEQLPNTRKMNTYIETSGKAANIYKLLHKDKRYSELRDRCNDNTHYNFYYNIVLNDDRVLFGERISILDQFYLDLENVFILHLAYLFYTKEQYMMSSDYVDSLECGITHQPDSQYFVAPFVQEIFDTVIKKSRLDLVMEIKSKTAILLE
jgi:hypothetical protein